MPYALITADYSTIPEQDIPATRLIPLEEFPSSAAALHHCSRCLLAVFVDPLRRFRGLVPLRVALAEAIARFRSGTPNGDTPLQEYPWVFVVNTSLPFPDRHRVLVDLTLSHAAGSKLAN